MSTFEAVQRADNIVDALLAIARGIDAIKSAPADDGRVEFFSVEWPTDESQQKKDAAKAATVEDLESKLENTTDPYERSSIEAALRLANDENRAMEPENTVGRTERVVAPNGDVIVDLPVASDEVRASRLKLAEKIGLGETWVDSFVTGGPLVLYYSDRDFVMGLPDDIRQRFVADVEQFNAHEAQEMARDILKNAEPDGTRTIFEEANRG